MDRTLLISSFASPMYSNWGTRVKVLKREIEQFAMIFFCEITLVKSKSISKPYFPSNDRVLNPKVKTTLKIDELRRNFCHTSSYMSNDATNRLLGTYSKDIETERKSQTKCPWKTSTEKGAYGEQEQVVHCGLANFRSLSCTHSGLSLHEQPTKIRHWRLKIKPSRQGCDNKYTYQDFRQAFRTHIFSK